MRGPLQPLLTHQGSQAPMIFCSETPFTICHTVVVQQIILSATFYSHTINTWWKIPSHTHLCRQQTHNRPTNTYSHTQGKLAHTGLAESNRKAPESMTCHFRAFPPAPWGARCLAQLRVPTAIARTTAWYRLYRVTNWFCMNHFIWFEFYNNCQDRYYLPPF